MRLRKWHHVYLLMAVPVALVGAASALIDRFDQIAFGTVPWPFVLFAVTGAWTTQVSSLGRGVLGGALMGLVMTGVRGLVMPLLGVPLPEEEQVMVLFYIEVAMVAGAILGLVGGLSVVALKRWRRRSTLRTKMPV